MTLSDLSAEAQPAFEVTTVPIGRFAEYDPIPADEEAAQVVKLLGEQLGAEEIHRKALPDERTQSVVSGLLADWAKHARPANAVLYWVGHGESAGHGAWLAAHDTGKPMSGTGIKPEVLADHIANQWARRREDGTWVVVVIEACGAKRFVDLLTADLIPRPNRPERLVLVGVGGHGESHLGSFRVHLSAALGSFTDNDTEIKLDDLMGRVRGRLTAGTVQVIDLAPVPTFRRPQVLPGGVTTPVDIYAELQSFLRDLPADERGHFIPKAQGTEQGELAWYFAGRARERQQICDWLHTETSGLLVVTGRAGSGKSALLGNILVYGNPDLRALLVRHRFIKDLVDHQRPPDGVFTEVVHLTGLTTAELVKRLLSVLGGPQVGTTLNEWLEQLIALLHDHEQPFTLLADALDESQEPTSIAASVLRRIAAQPGCRVVVGTRRSTKEGPDQPETKDENLLDALGRGANTRIVEVARDPVAISEYIGQRLGAATRQHRLPQDTSVEAIAELIQAQPGREFLYARLAVHEILVQPELVQPANRTRLNELLAHDHRRLFAQAVARVAALNPVNDTLLRALALSLGRGLPRADRIWALVATALKDDAAAPVGENEIDQILQVAAPYIMLDAEDGQSVYRLAHRTFQEHFAGGSVTRDRQAALRVQHARVATALLSAAQAGLPGEPNRYVQRHLAGHVAASASWSALAQLPDVLDRLDPDSVAAGVLAHAFGRGGEALPAEIAAVVSTRHLLGPLRPEERRLTRAVAMARLGSDALRRAQSAPKREGEPRLRWATLEPSATHVALAGHTGAVTSLVALPLADGRCLLASGSTDRTIRLWDPVSGSAVGAPLAGHTGWVTSLAALHLADGRCLLASGSEDRIIRLWDPASGSVVGAPFAGHTGRLKSLAALPLPDGRCLLASGSSTDKTIWLWDPASGSAAGAPFVGHTWGVESLAVLPLPDGRCLLASGSSSDKTIRLWDPASGSVVGALQTRWWQRWRLAGHTERVTSLAALPLADGRCLLASGSSSDRSVRLWDPTSGSAVGAPLAAHSREVTSLAALPLADGHCLLASGSADGTIRLWDPASGSAVGAPLAGHTREVTSLAALTLADGRCLLASGSADKTIRLWDPVSGGAVGAPLAGHTRQVTLLAALPLAGGRCLLASRGEDGSIRLWDPTSGSAVGALRTRWRERWRLTERVTSLAALPLADGRCLLASGSTYGTIQLWDPASSSAVGKPLAGHTGSVTSLATLSLADGRCLLASGSWDQTIRLWDPVSGNAVGAPFVGYTGRIGSLAALPLGDGRCLLASGSSLDSTIRLWDPASGNAVGMPLAGHTESVTSLAALPLGDGRCLLASGSEDRTIRLWDPASGSAVGAPLAGHTREVTLLAAIPLADGRCLLASGSSEETVRLWDIQDGRNVRVWGMEIRIGALAWSSNSLVVAGDAGLVAIELE